MKADEQHKSHSYVKIINTYLMVCIAVLVISIPIFLSMINKQDLETSKCMCNLIAEKINNSITYLTESVKGRADILSNYTIEDWDDLYKNLSDNLDVEGCNSIGLIDNDNNLYGRKNENSEFEKWGLKEQAKNADKIFFSAPYRQGVSGKMVVTIFVPIHQNNERVGELFMTYALEEIQNMAHSNILEDDVEIYLMNPYSHNYIRCFGVDKTLIGSWNNTKLLYNQIKTVKGKTYQEWERAMRDGKNGEVVYFKIDKTMYTQVFVNLDVIKDWSVVVRIPNNALSYNLRVFHIAVIVVSVVLIFSLLIIYILSNKSVEAEKQMLEYLSIQDPLTKLENRRSFKNVFDNYLMNRKESSLNGALIFFDIDYFKQVNDGFGHAMGDKVLQEFANITKEIFADNGKVFRYGGDEFILLIQHLESREKIEKQLKELRRRLKELDFLVDKNGKVFQIHFSAGIVEITEQMDSFKVIEKKADKALYQVKQRGRNGFEWYSD